MNHYITKKAIKTTTNNITFDSKLEATHYLYLQNCLKQGLISDLKLQPPYKLYAYNLTTGKFKAIATYYADFSFFDKSLKKTRIIDSKPSFSKKVFSKQQKCYVKKTKILTVQPFPLKKKLCEFCHDLDIEIWTQDNFGI